jgi:hypothetical protein
MIYLMPNIKVSELKRYFKNSLFFLSVIFLSISAFAGTTPPITTFEKEPNSPDGNNSWYRQPVKVTLSATDLESGVNEIFYRVDGGIWVKKDFSNSLNLAPNPSFEISSATPPLDTQDWKISNSNPGAGYSRDTIVYMPSFANTSIKINSTEDTWHSIDHYDMFAAANSFNNMSAYVWIKTLNISGSAYFNIYSISQDPLGQITTNFIKSSPSITGTNDWTKLSANFTPIAENVIGVYVEIGFLGTGSIWIDAVNINKSDTPTTSFYVSSDGYHTVEYYSVDKAGNAEATKSKSFKIDQTPPGNWHDSGAVRGLLGNDHELYCWINVTDSTSGISTFTDKFQYTTKNHLGEFGRYSTLLSCGSTWMPGGWVILVSPPFSPGVKKAYLLTPKVDFCDDDWKECSKMVRFRAVDMAGNISTKDVCINGPWIKVRGKGIVRANQNIDMVSEAPVDEVNTDGLVEVGGQQISFFTSNEDLYLTEVSPGDDYNYDKMFQDIEETKTEISPSDDLISSSGVYYISGDYEITDDKVPSDYSSDTFNQIVFIDGDLTISDDIIINKGSTVLFVVSGIVEIDYLVKNVEAAIFTDETISTAYNVEEGEECETLVLRGIYVADKFNFQRTLRGTQNEWYPSESIIYEPKYITKMSDYIKNNSVRWVYSD